jgi:hypothetical protein
MHLPSNAWRSTRATGTIEEEYAVSVLLHLDYSLVTLLIHEFVLIVARG